MSECSFPVDLHSCYAEEVDKVEECSTALESGVKTRELGKLVAANSNTAGMRLVSTLPSGAITIALTQPDVVLAPIIQAESMKATRQLTWCL